MQDQNRTYCMICLQLKTTAVVTSCCCKVICKQCSEGIKKIGNRCPNCRKENLETQTSVYLSKSNQSVNPANEIQFQTNCVECHSLAHQALVFSCCGCLICQECIILQQGKRCPNCREKNYTLKMQPFVRKFLRQISKDIQFFVKALTGNSIVLTLKQFDPINLVFNRVSERESVSVQQIRLTCAGKNIKNEDCSTLRSYKIKTNTTVQMLLRLKGG